MKITWWMKLRGNLPLGHAYDALTSGTGSFICPVAQTKLDIPPPPNHHQCLSLPSHGSLVVKVVIFQVWGELNRRPVSSQTNTLTIRPPPPPARMQCMTTSDALNSAWEWNAFHRMLSWKEGATHRILILTWSYFHARVQCCWIISSFFLSRSVFILVAISSWDRSLAHQGFPKSCTFDW